MFSGRRTAFYLLLFVFIVPVFAQKEEDAAKERQQKLTALLGQIVSNSRGLKLPENRAFVAARAGSAICKADEKQARKFFETVGPDLIAGQAEAEAQTRNKQYLTNLAYGQEPRWNVLFLVANCDASLALDIMARTRPPRLERALAELAASNNGSYKRGALNPYNTGQFANTEIQNEQRLIALAADQDPSRAIRLVHESLKKGVTYQTLSLLQKILMKDAPAANRLAEEALQKLIDTDLTQNNQAAETISYFLVELTRDLQPGDAGLRVPENLIREAAEEMAGFWLDPDVTGFYGSGAFPAVEKYFPARAAQAKRKFDSPNNPNQTPRQRDYQRMMSGEVPVEEMVSRAEKMEPYMRNEIYRRAAQKLVDAGDVAQAEKLIEDNMPDNEAENYLSQIRTNQAYKTMGAGNFEEAQNLINNIPNLDQRINILVYLANSIYQKDPKANDKWAASVIGQARALLPDEPETYNDFSALFNIATNSAPFDPDGAFRIAESVIPTLNELAQANATLGKLRDYGNYRNGEFQITSGQYAVGVSGMEALLRTLKDKDLDRTIRITNQFARLDTRIAFQLQLIDPGMLSNLPINSGRGGLYTIDGLRKSDK